MNTFILSYREFVKFNITYTRVYLLVLVQGVSNVLYSVYAT